MSVIQGGIGFIVIVAVAVLIVSFTVVQQSSVQQPMDDGNGKVSNGKSTLPEPVLQADGSVLMESIVDDDAFKGSQSAPITIVEFSDFQCPFCKRSWELYLGPGKALQDYLDSGKVKVVYRDFALSLHPEAEPAAIAGECAEEQGKFWEFHDKIFENQQEMSADSYLQWADDIEIDVQEFSSCIDSGKYVEEVRKDLQDGGAVGVSGTPTFFIGPSNGEGKKIVGAQPWDVIKAAIDEYL